MTRRAQSHASNFGISPRAATVVLTVFMLAVAAVPAAQGQTYSVIHNFNGSDGDSPQVGLDIRQGGKLVRDHQIWWKSQCRYRFQSHASRLSLAIYPALQFYRRLRRLQSRFQSRLWPRRQPVRHHDIRRPVSIWCCLQAAAFGFSMQNRNLSLDGDGAVQLHWPERWRRS